MGQCLVSCTIRCALVTCKANDAALAAVAGGMGHARRIATEQATAVQGARICVLLCEHCLSCSVLTSRQS